MITCEKYNYPYPDECLNAVLFLNQEGCFFYDIVISQNEKAVQEHVLNKILLGKYKYLGYLKKIQNIKYENLKTNLPAEYKKHIYSEIEKVKTGKKAEKEPLYIYSEFEVNETLTD